MNEDLLRYFTGQGNPTTETIEPQVIELDNIECEFMRNSHTLKTKDENYFIKYGGFLLDGEYKAIEIYDNNKNLIKKYDNITIATYPVRITDLKQDEEGRFYGIAEYFSSTVYFEALVLFNNFIQDNELVIRKYYTGTTMGFNTTDYSFDKIVKDNNLGTYYIADTSYNKVYKFTIDILSGNSLTTFNIIDNGFDSESFAYESSIFCIDNKFIYLKFKKDYTSNKQEYLKAVIDQNYSEENIELNPILTTTRADVLDSRVAGISIENLVFKYAYYLANGNDYKINIDFVDMDGNIKTIILPDKFNNTTGRISVYENYIFVADGTTVKGYIFDYYSTATPLKFLDESYTGLFLQPQILRTFNYNVLMGVGGSQGTSLSYLKFIYSRGYSSIPYYNNNFLVPQYLNLYTNSEDDTSVVYSRDISNRFLAGNQLTTTFNIPNYLLNDFEIESEKLYGQTNMVINNNLKELSKNRFESLYLNYIHNIYINDNTNATSQINMAGSNRLADSVWNSLDYQASPLKKARITYEDESEEIINLPTPTIAEEYGLQTATYTYQVEGHITKIEYLSNDEQTVYATYRKNLNGTNTITQKITIEEG